MKKLIGLLIITLAVVGGIIAYQIRDLANSIYGAASIVHGTGNSVSWGSGVPTFSYVLLSLLVVIALILVFSKEKNNK